MVTDQGIVVALASLDGVAYRRPADDETSVQDGRQVSQLFQFPDECRLEVIRDLGPELEQHCTWN